MNSVELGVHQLCTRWFMDFHEEFIVGRVTFAAAIITYVARDKNGIERTRLGHCIQ